MYRNLLILLLATIALVCAQSSTNTSISNGVTATTLSPVTNATESPTTNTTESPKPTTPTTTPKPNTTTTEKPTPAPTPAPTPSPVPKPEQWSGKVTDSQTNTTCISVQFSVQIKFKYNGTETKELTTGFTIPANASVDSKDSYCSPKNETKLEMIAIRFDNSEHTSAILTLKFNKTTDNSVSVEEIDLSFKATKELMPQIDPKLEGKILKASKSGLNLFKVAPVHSYVCSAVQSASLESEEAISDVQIEFTNSKVEAYMTESSKGNFDSEIDCKSSDISDVVPIAVGAALAGLVVIVLIAYFIGRRRSRRLAYQSV